MIIYGWNEQNGASYGLSKEEIDGDWANEDEDGQLYGPSVPHGQWYKSFAVARKKLLDFWRSERDIALQALKHVRELKESDL